MDFSLTSFLQCCALEIHLFLQIIYFLNRKESEQSKLSGQSLSPFKEDLIKFLVTGSLIPVKLYILWFIFIL